MNAFPWLQAWLELTDVQESVVLKKYSVIVLDARVKAKTRNCTNFCALHSLEIQILQYVCVHLLLLSTNYFHGCM